jgi:multiple sugar transport system ATP-binding protein
MRGRLRVNGRATFETEGGFVLPIANVPANSDGRPLVCGIRPEQLSVDSGGIPAEVVVVEPTGSETQVIARHGDQEITCLFRDRITARPGENIHISANPALVHLFDSESGSHL